MKKFFTEAELGQIKSAVAEAEKATSAEIVPVFFESCGNYHDTYWKSGIIFATLWSFLFAIYQSSAVGIWNISLQFFFLTQMTAGILGVIAAYFFPPWKRLLMDRVDVKRRIQDVAFKVFLQEGIYKTKERTGMLLFMSFLEKEAVVLGDEGINKEVSPAIWEGILSQLTEGMKKGEKTTAIIQTIQSMGNLLKQYPIKPNDTNELRDDLRIGDGK
jgi:putative membrane protein